jgi:hypothetical protein
MAFVFQKVKSPDRALAPPLPPPESVRGGPGGGGPGGRFGGPGANGRGPGGHHQQQQQQQQQHYGGRREQPAATHPRFQPNWVNARATYAPPLLQAYAYNASKQAPARRAQGRFVFVPQPPQWVAGVPQEVQRRYGYYDYREQQQQQQQQHGGGNGGAAGAGTSQPPPAAAAAAAGGGGGGDGGPQHAGSKRKAEGQPGGRVADPIGYSLGADAGDAGDAGGRQLLAYDDDFLDGPVTGVTPGVPAGPQYAPDDDD